MFPQQDGPSNGYGPVAESIEAGYAARRESRDVPKGGSDDIKAGY